MVDMAVEAKFKKDIVVRDGLRVMSNKSKEKLVNALAKMRTGVCEMCNREGRVVSRDLVNDNGEKESKSLCLWCLQKRARKRFLEREYDGDLFDNLEVQPGRTTYDDCRRLSDVSMQ